MQAATDYNRLETLFQEKPEQILSMYFTAGYPRLTDTTTVLEGLAAAGADIIEIGMPYSDPIADGPTIQESNTRAIRNGMTLHTLFDQLKGIRKSVDIPLILMGYINPVMQYGMERFCEQCQSCGIDGLILPDLPMQEYLDEYKPMFEQYGLRNVFLITPQTSEDRIRQIDENTKGFIYMVSSASTTGAKKGMTEVQISYFERIQAMQLRNPRIIGFGISDHPTFSKACEYAHGAIIGSAFIRLLAENEGQDLKKAIHQFIASVRGSA